jgi:hypothetical protein
MNEMKVRKMTTKRERDAPATSRKEVAEWSAARSDALTKDRNQPWISLPIRLGAGALTNEIVRTRERRRLAYGIRHQQGSELRAARVDETVHIDQHAGEIALFAYIASAALIA